jgi:hypothetical protein
MRRALALVISAACFGLPTGAGAATFSNPTPLGPADGAPLPPYPSFISVTGQQGTTTSVTATLVGVTGAEVRQLDALLVGPGGRSMLISDACSNAVIPSWTGTTVTLDDRIGTTFSDPCPPTSPSGTFRPVDVSSGLADNFPGVPPPYPVSLAAFNGLSPNGIWSLYVVDDSVGDNLGIAGGWRLDVTTTAPPAKKKKKKCKKAKKRRTAAAARRCRKKKRG